MWKYREIKKGGRKKKKSHQVLKINLRLRGQNCLFPVAHHIIKTHKANSSHYNFYLDIYLSRYIYIYGFVDRLKHSIPVA